MTRACNAIFDTEHTYVVQRDGTLVPGMAHQHVRPPKSSVDGSHAIIVFQDMLSRFSHEAARQEAIRTHSDVVGIAVVDVDSQIDEVALHSTEVMALADNHSQQGWSSVVRRSTLHPE